MGEKRGRIVPVPWKEAVLKNEGCKEWADVGGLLATLDQSDV